MNGKEPIEWIVLDKKDGKALLISKYGLDSKRYNTTWTSVTWENCTLRTWLNNDFVKNAFSEDEQSAILITEVDNSSGQGYDEWDASGGNNTQDRIFLLSYAEANKYLNVTPDDSNNIASRAAPTAYAENNGAITNGSYQTADGTATGWWWLRSPGARQHNAARVDGAGSLYYYYVNYDHGCVRPALWVNLESADTLILEPKETSPSISSKETSKDARAGNIVIFGNYEQDNDLTNGKEPIEWIVLDKKDGKALLISKYGLDSKRYNTKWTSVTWENCTLRTWLNHDFVRNAFSEDEQSAILITEVDNSSGQGYDEWDASGGNNTQDRIFLLSYAEANKYLNVTPDDSNNIASRAAPTAYAENNGAITNGSYQTADGAAAGWWWLRSPGDRQHNAARVDGAGSLYYYYVNYDHGCVRPALWVNLESDFFR